MPSNKFSKAYYHVPLGNVTTPGTHGKWYVRVMRLLHHYSLIITCQARA